MTIGYSRDERNEYFQRLKHAVLAQAIRDGLLFALILHAVLTVLLSPKRSRR